MYVALLLAFLDYCGHSVIMDSRVKKCVYLMTVIAMKMKILMSV